MKIAELSRRAGVPVPTIKYYLREGLLPPGEFSSPNQASYGEEHVRRLRLVRGLLEVGRLPIATIRELFADLERPDPDLHRALGRALRSSASAREPVSDEDLADAERETAELIDRRGWLVSPDALARRAVAEVIAAFHQLGVGDQMALLDEYAEAAEMIAAADLDLIRRRTEPAAMVHAAVVGTILGDALNAGLRRLAQEDASAKMFHTSGGPEDPPKER